MQEEAGGQLDTVEAYHVITGMCEDEEMDE